MIKVLVTGSNGQLGNQLRLLSQEFDNYDFLFTDIQELDITNEDDVDDFLTDFQPAWVINCAAYTAVDKAETEADKATLINADAPAILSKLTDKHRIRMVHISTDYVFDGQGFTPYKEGDTKNPRGVYAKSKSLGEDLVIVNNPRSIILRTSWLYSVYGQNFLKTIIRVGSEKGQLKVVSDQIGSPTWAGDLAVAILTMIDQESEPGIYNFSNEGVCSWYDFAKAIVSLKGIPCDVEPITTREYPTAAERPHYSVLDKSLFKKTTGIRIPWWFESLEKCILQLDKMS